MKKVFIFCALMCIISLAQSQSRIKLHPNCNGGVLPLTQEELDVIPTLNISPPSAELSLPLKVDNSQLPYMPKTFGQKGGSCTQASSIQYIFSYEVNRVRGTSPQNNNYHNHFHHLSTFNHIRYKTSSGEYAARWTDGWDMIKENGLPDYATYGNWDNNLTYWMDGYNKWYSGGQYRVEDNYLIKVKINGDGLDDLKHWLHDHGNAESTGGLAGLTIYSDLDYHQGSGDLSGEAVIDAIYVTNSLHAVTVVGYDDTFKQDINGDGLYTNDIDINGDSIVNMRDWEKGALKLANSWGEDWPQFNQTEYGNGYFHLPYRLMIKEDEFIPDSVNCEFLHICKVQINHPIELAVKFQVISNNRRASKIYLNYGENTDYEMEDLNDGSTIPLEYYNTEYSIDEVPMQGLNRSME